MYFFTIYIIFNTLKYNIYINDNTMQPQLNINSNSEQIQFFSKVFLTSNFHR